MQFAKCARHGQNEKKKKTPTTDYDFLFSRISFRRKIILKEIIFWKL